MRIRWRLMEPKAAPFSQHQSVRSAEDNGINVCSAPPHVCLSYGISGPSDSCIIARSLHFACVCASAPFTTFPCDLFPAWKSLEGFCIGAYISHTPCTQHRFQSVPPACSASCSGRNLDSHRRAIKVT